MSRLTRIKQLRASGVSIFCDWRDNIDWLIEQVEKYDGIPEGKFPNCDTELQVLRDKIEEYEQRQYRIERAVKS